MIAVAVIGIVGLLAGLIALNGVMLSYVWEWFVVPLGVPSIGVAQAVGIAILASMVTHEGVGATDEGGEGLRRVIINIVAKFVVFGIAYLISFAVQP